MARVRVRVVQVVLLTVFQTIFGLSQETEHCKEAQQYPDPEPASLVEMGPLVVSRVQGRAVLVVRDKTLPPDKLREVCLSLFTADTRKFVASTTPDRKGSFDFGSIPPGDYRLIQRAPGLCTGNTAIRVTAARSKRRQRTIIVRFRAHGIDVCSGADYDRM